MTSPTHASPPTKNVFVLKQKLIFYYLRKSNWIREIVAVIKYDLKNMLCSLGSAQHLSGILDATSLMAFTVAKGV